MEFSGKVALVTGSSSGIGAAIAKELAAQGATVAIHYRGNADGAQQIAAQISEAGGVCEIFQADVGDLESAQALVKAVEDSLGAINILVNNAGTTADTLLLSMKPEEWERVIQTNLNSVFYVTKAAMRKMLRARWGRIINITSVVGLAGQAGQTNYAASKAGIIGFTKSLAREVGSRNITVNAVAPGFIPTALTDVLTDEQKAQTIASTPVGRLGEPEEIAWAVAFLAAERSGFITGHVLTVDGGLVMQ
ncbi:MAG: 3-oxoacyl-[acyl-carrier-protein] reductase [Caldilineaceae bacterium]|nr:3-oxoacyl-[acyl-carrier-protein] reductase [Caldilineaceae bacterium]